MMQQQQQQKVFGVKVEDGRKGEVSVGPVYRNPLAHPAFPPTDPNSSTAWHLFRASVEKYPANRMLGWREPTINCTNPKWGPYVWKTYQQVYEEVVAVASALRAHSVQPGARVGIYGSNCPQWIVAMQACGAQSLICVPLYDTLGPGAVDFIIDHAEIDCVFVQHQKLKQLLSCECTHAQRLKLIVCLSSLTEQEKDMVVSSIHGVIPYSWNEFLQLGKEKGCDPCPPNPMDICTIMYTSGTSGDPKGVILTHQNITTCIAGVDLFLDQFPDKMTVDDVYISFLPLAHILDRMIEEYFFHKGASVGYYHGDINEISDDLVELKPTFLAGVPRVFQKIHQGVLKALEELNPVRRKVFDMLYSRKLNGMKSGYKHTDASWLADLLAFRKVKARLGGRVRLIVSGAAPLSSEVEEFLRVTTCAFVVQGYGLTETCGLATLGFPDEMCLIGTVGSAFVYNEIRLEEVPEMGYDPLADPSRGEICIRGMTPFAGYYKNPELTQQAVSHDGWFHTGDIGEMSSDGVVRIIDRKKNLIKLSQGEYVAVEHLEKIYTVTPIVEDVWVYGDSYKSMLVALVVPNAEHTAKWAENNGYGSQAYSGVCSLQQLQQYVLQELSSTAQRNKLRGFEYIKGVILESQPLELQPHDLVTPTMKKKRDKLVKHYKVEIDGLYSKLAAHNG